MCLKETIPEERAQQNHYRRVPDEVLRSIEIELTEQHIPDYNPFKFAAWKPFSRKGEVCAVNENLKVGSQSGLLDELHKVIVTCDNSPLAPILLDKIAEDKASHYVCPVRDSRERMLPFVILKSVRALEEARRLGKHVYIHCVAGVNRSAAAAVAVLMIAYRMNMGQAFNEVASACGPILNNHFFRAELQQLENVLKMKSMI